MSEILSIANLQVEQGNKAKGTLLLSERNDGSPLETPVLVVHGKDAGPRFCVTAAVHGDEYEGIQAVLELYEELNPAELSGTFIGVPVANPLAYAGLSRTAPQDGGNLNRVFPGQVDGSITSRVAHSLFNALTEWADFHMDLHSGGLSLYLYPYAIYHADGEAGESGRALALATGCDLIAVSRGDEAKGLLYAELTRVGIPSIIVECGGAGVMKSEYARKHKEGILSVMHHLEMLQGTRAKPPRQRVIEKQQKLYAPSGGMVFFTISAGSTVEKGQEIGCIMGTDGTVKDVLRAPRGGLVTWYRAIPVVCPGDLVASIRQVAEVVENKEGKTK